MRGRKQPLVRGLKEQRRCLHISASYLHCLLGDYQHTIPSLQDYRDKIKPEWILHSSNRDVFTKAKLFEAFFFKVLTTKSRGGGGNGGTVTKLLQVVPKLNTKRYCYYYTSPNQIRQTETLKSYGCNSANFDKDKLWPQSGPQRNVF